MINRLSSYLLYGNLFCGIEHTVGGDNIYVTLLKKQKTSVDVFDSFKISTIDELPSKLKKQQHATLVINTDKVLTKKVEISSNKEMELVFHAFPNIDLEQFYYEIFCQNNSCFVSICRKDYVNKLISTYAKSSVIVTDFFLGNLVVSSVCGFINEDTLYSSNTVIYKKGNEIDNIVLAKASHLIDYNINGVATNNNFLLSLTGGVLSILKNYNPLTNALVKKDSLRFGFKQSQLFNLFLKCGLGLIFISLLINYLIFNHYFNNVKDLQSVSLYNKEASQKMMRLKREVDSIQKLAEDMLQMESSRSSFFINSIMQKLPNSILLSELNYQPLLKNIKDNDPIIFDSHRILLSGESTNSEIFSLWLSELERFNWLSKVEIVAYNDVSTSKSNFSIKLFLKS